MILFAWDGFPQYAARCVRAFVRSTNEKVVVVATRPDVPVEGMERVCNCPVRWINGDGLFDLRLLDCLVGQEERITLVVSGWCVPAFNRLAADVRAKGGRVICMVDNYMMGGGFFGLGLFDCLIELLRAVRFRLTLRKRFDGFLVPGKAGHRLLRFYGIPDEKIAEGMYAADETLFKSGPSLSERPKKVIYVGQFIERKNVKRLVEAFQKAKAKDEGEQRWELHLYGSGPLKDELNQTIRQSNNQTIHIHDFVQPEQLADLYRSARFFCLPSLEEHWGLVVHEAALSGCGLLLSNRIGAAEDLLAEGKNGLTFDPLSVDDMARVMDMAMETDDVMLTTMQQESLRLAMNASLEKFVEGVKRLTV